MNRGQYSHLLQILEPASPARIYLDVLVEVNVRANNRLDLKGKKKKGAEKNGEEKIQT
jgi:hypothetical protein